MLAAMKPIRALIARVLRSAHYDQASVMIGYLRGSGWFRSLRSGKPENSAGDPLPWYSYPCIHLLDARLGSEPIDVYEFGSGNSTLWWARRARRVVSVEDNSEWYSYVRSTGPANVTYTLAAGEDDYVQSLRQTGVVFDVVVVDGSHRGRCLHEALGNLTERGVVIVDNSDWPWLAADLARAESAGFRRLELYGLGPINGHPWGTSILYRGGNFLGL